MKLQSHRPAAAAAALSSPVCSSVLSLRNMFSWPCYVVFSLQPSEAVMLTEAGIFFNQMDLNVVTTFFSVRSLKKQRNGHVT